MKIKRLVSAMVLVLSGAVHAETIFIDDADIYTGSKLLVQHDMLVVDGQIKSIGAGLLSPAGAKVFAAEGQSVTPGIFNADTHIGVVEIGAIAQTVDSASKNRDFTVAMKVADAFNPNTTLIPFNRSMGLTHALVVPDADAGMFAGQAALVEFSADRPKVLMDKVAVVVALGEKGQSLAGGSRAVALAQLREALRDAKDYQLNTKAAEAGERRDYSLSLADIRALQSVIDGSTPLLVEVHRAADIERVLDLAADYKLRLILSGVAEGWMVAEQIAAAQVPVIIDPILNLPLSYEMIGARLENAELLHKAGVKLMFTGMGGHNTHNAHLVRQSAGNAVANGLDKLVALQAMSLNPAEVFGLESVGELREGATANLVIWDGDPFEVETQAQAVLVQGQSASLVSRATRLRDRYYQMYKPQ